MKNKKIKIKTVSDLAFAMAEIERNLDDNFVLDDNDPDFRVSAVKVKDGKVYLEFEDYKE